MRVNVDGRRRMKIEDVHVIIFPLQIWLPEIGEDLGAHGRGADQKGQLDHRRQRKASGGPAGDAPCQVGNARLGAIVLLSRLAERSAGEYRDLYPAVGALLDLLHPRHDDVGMVVMRGGSKVGEFELDLLGCYPTWAPHRGHDDESKCKAGQAPKGLYHDRVSSLHEPTFHGILRRERTFIKAGD